MSFALTRLLGDGSTQTFTIGFTYRDTSDLVVEVDGVTQTEGGDYTITLGGSQVTFNTAPANDAAILIRRATSHTSRLVDYTAGAVFKEADLDTDSTQGFYMAQEAIDIAQDSISKNSLNEFDAEGLRIINVANPIDDQDGATKDYVQSALANLNAKYHGPLPEAPSSPSVGDLWFDTSIAVMRVYTGYKGWASAGADSVINGTTNRYNYIVGTPVDSYTGSTTVFPANYDAGFLDVYLNGVRLTPGSGFTAPDGISVILSTPASISDELSVVAYGLFELAPTQRSVHERIVATEGQTEFVLTNSFLVDANNLNVFVNGTLQTTNEYVENDSQTITFSTPLSAGDNVDCYIGQTLHSTSASSTTVTHVNDGTEYNLATFINDLDATVDTLDSTEITHTPSGGTQTTIADYLDNRHVVNVKDFGAVGDGVTDDTAAFQSAIDTGYTVHIPDGEYEITGTINISIQNQLIINRGSLVRHSAVSSSTVPIIRFTGNVQVTTFDNHGGEIRSENDSPNGIVLFGTDAPSTDPSVYNVLWNTFTGGKVQGAGESTTDKLRIGIAIQSNEGWGVSTGIYANIVDGVRVSHVSNGMFFNAEANGNLISNINFYFTGLNAVLMDGTGDGARTITDNSFVNSFVHFSLNGVDLLKCIRVNRNNFFGWCGEGGSGRLYNFDSNSSSNQFFGYDNYPISPVDNGRTNNISRNNKFIVDNVDANTGTIDSVTSNSVRVQDTGSGYNRTDYSPGTTFGGYGGGQEIEPTTATGSGTVKFSTHFKSNEDGAGVTRHDVFADGQIGCGDVLYPLTDNAHSCGLASLRWSQVYAGNGTINTSDEREKTFLEVNSAELAAAAEIKSNLRKYKWNSALAGKGDGARIHFGANAQQVGQIMESHGLDPDEYGFYCYDEWEDENGNKVGRYGIRYYELLTFIMMAT